MTKTTIYTVHLRTDIDSAEIEITARSPRHALAKARAIASDDDRRDKLYFEAYTGRFPVNEIAIEAPDGEEVATWLDHDLLCRLAADELLAALEMAVKALNTAHRFHVPSLGRDSYEVARRCKRAISKAKGELEHDAHPRTSDDRCPIEVPPDPAISNADRAEWAAHALDQYGSRKEGRADYDTPEDMAADLICDLLHLLRAHDHEDPIRKLETARMHFEAEEAEETPSRKRRKRT